MPLIKFTCEICRRVVEKKIPPSVLRLHPPRFCSTICVGKGISLTRGDSLASELEILCEECGKKFIFKQRKDRSRRRFCSKKCANVNLSRSGKAGFVGYDVLFKHWKEKFGEEVAEKC